MNLDNVLRDPSKEGALADHDWWVEGLIKDGELTYDPSENYRDNNTKDELEIQWGYGTIQPTYSNEEEIPVPAGAVDRNLPQDALGDAGPVIMFARDLMNRGVMGASLQRQLREKFEQNTLRRASSGLKELFNMEGIIGCIAVDTRGYDNAKQAIASAKKSPNSRFIKYVIAEERARDDYDWLPSSRGQQVSASKTSGNAVDDFFGSQKVEAYKPNLIAHCKETMLPVLAGAGDIDDSELDDTLVEMMNVTGIPGPVKQDIEHNGKYASSLKKIQVAFLWLDRSRSASERVKYVQKVDASEFIIGCRDQEIDIQAEHRVEPLDISHVNHASQNQMDELIFFDDSQINIGELDAPFDEVSLNPMQVVNAAIDVDVFGGQMEFSLMDEVVAQDVSIAQHEDPMFIGGDIEFDDKPRHNGEMSVELGSSMEW